MRVSPAAVDRELKQGRIILRDSQWRLVEKIEVYILEKDFFPYTAIEKLKEDHDYLKTPIPLHTLYNCIENEFLGNITKRIYPAKEKAQRKNIPG